MFVRKTGEKGWFDPISGSEGVRLLLLRPEFRFFML
jgi:hypothetical protein